MYIDIISLSLSLSTNLHSDINVLDRLRPRVLVQLGTVVARRIALEPRLFRFEIETGYV